MRKHLITAAAGMLLITACSAGTTTTPSPAASSAPSQPAASATAAAPSQAAAACESLKVAFSGQPDFTQVANFEWLDQLNAAGVAAEPLIFEGTDPPFRAVIAGDADMVVGQVPPGIKLDLEAGEDLQMIAADVQRSDYILVSTPDITSPADLVGKKVGTAGAGAVSDSLSLIALKNEGVDTEGIEFIQVGGTGARMAALLSNQVQAGVAHAAEGFDAISQGLNNLLPIGESIGPYLFHGVWAKKSWLDGHRDCAQQAIDGFIDSTRWAADNKDEYISIAKEKVEGLSDEAMDKAYDLFLQIELFAVNGGLDDDTVQATLDIEQEVGNLPAEIPDQATWLDSSFVEDYLSRNGEQ